jgi:hypothetical protein
MAEIKLEKKPAASMTWLWILAALLLAVILAWWIWAGGERSEGVSRLERPLLLEWIAPSQYAIVPS